MTHFNWLQLYKAEAPRNICIPVFDKPDSFKWQGTNVPDWSTDL